MTEPKQFNVHTPYPEDSPKFNAEYAVLLENLAAMADKDTIVANLTELSEIISTDLPASKWFCTPNNLEFTIQRLIEYGVDRRFIRLRKRPPNMRTMAILFLRTMAIGVRKKNEMV